MRSRLVMRLWVGLFLLAVVAAGQSTGTVSGTVLVDTSGEPMHAARVILSPLGRSADTDEGGKYEFVNVPPGSYDILATSPGLAADRVTVQVTAGATATMDLRLRLAPVKESITVTATGREEVVTNALQSVAVLDLTQLPIRNSASLGEVLENEPGIAKRSSGPGNGRPVIRGFDGDRVLMLEDGVRTGTLSFQSGDHGEPVDVNQLERIEVVRGPATLLYGSSAVGGVVNVISRHDLHQHPDQGVRGFLTGSGGSNNGLGSGSGGFEFGAGNWQFWASGGGLRTGDYSSAAGKVFNSGTRMEQTNGGLGYYGSKAFASFNYAFTDSQYGVPYDPAEEDPEIPTLKLRRNGYRTTFGLKDLGFFDAITAKVNYTDYHHEEVVENEVETAFFNKQVNYQLTFDQKKKGMWSGSFGLWGLHRDYKTEGEEAIAPPTLQNGFAVFALENIDLESKTRIQFGGRLEHNAYNPTGLDKRSFTGFSGSVGVSQKLWNGGALAVNYSHAYRAPALEELYNNGPHPGNATFEIGNPNLTRERNDGIDVSLRHQSSRLRGELNFFAYHFSNFIYFAPTGEFEDGLPVADYAQGNSNFRGFEAKLDVGLHRNFWLNLGSDAVRARLTEGDTPLPRIPPVRGRIGFDARYKGLSFKPEVVLANSQTGVFTTETPTAGYAVVNMQGSYTLSRPHHLQIFSANFFNLGDNLYRNHLSFLKAFAPEIGRGIRVSYTIQFF